MILDSEKHLRENDTQKVRDTVAVPHACQSSFSIRFGTLLHNPLRIEPFKGMSIQQTGWKTSVMFAEIYQEVQKGSENEEV